ncbi:protein-serine/threonine phosphatase [Ranunculus cassubicifolius]
MNFYILKRPHVEELLESLSKCFEIVVFTASLKEYAFELGGRYVKDLSEIGRDLKNVVLVDDNPNAYVFQPENALPVQPFVDDLKDRELEKVIKFFEKADEFDDMREGGV